MLEVTKPAVLVEKAKREQAGLNPEPFLLKKSGQLFFNTYFKRAVLPHAPDAWIDHDKTKVGYEIPFNRHFYVFQPPRPLGEIDAELKACTDRILTMIGGLTQ